MVMPGNSQRPASNRARRAATVWALCCFACAACQVIYPIREDIPVMLVEEAVDMPTWNAQHPQAKERA